MIRISTIFIAICMVLIASSLGLALYTLAGIQPMQAALVAVAALTILILYNAAAMRLRDRTDVGGQIADLSRGTADLARQVAEFGRRLHALEGKFAGASGNMERRVDPLREEISELGGLVKQLAVSVAAHDELLNPDPGAEPPPPAIAPVRVVPAEPAPPVVPERTERPAAPPARPPVKAEGRPAAPSKPAAPVDDPRLVAAVKDAVDANRIDLHLQPMVTLPQRKVRYYEAMSRIRDRDDNVIAASDFIEIAEKSGAMARIDEAVLLRCVQVLRRLLVRNKDVGLFCNLSGATLRDTDVFGRCLDFLDANRALAPSFVLEIKQNTLRSLGPTESENLAALAQRGYRFSIDNVTDLRFEPRELADRSVRFVKVPAALLLDPARASDIHPSDLSDMLGRFGIDLVAERIEGERAVVDLLDYDVRFGQGFLFSPPRPLRTETPQPPAGVASVEPPPAPAPVPARTQGVAALARRSAT